MSDGFFFVSKLLFVLSDAMIGKTIEEEFTGEPGGIFCTVCDTHCEGGTCIEDGDLTTHLMSETHEIEVKHYHSYFLLLLLLVFVNRLIANQTLLVNRYLGNPLRLYLTAS